MNRYIVKTEDLKGDIADFPIEVVQRMVDYQVEQGNKADVNIFQEYPSKSFLCGGFDWNKTHEGYNFWCEIISDENFNVFFQRYPKKSIIYSDIENKSEDLPIDTPVMVQDNNTPIIWYLRFYAGNNRCWQDGLKSSETKYADDWCYIIPFDKFDPTDIKKSLKYNIVK